MQIQGLVARVAAVSAGFVLAALLWTSAAFAGDELMLCDFEAADSLKVVEGRAKVELVAEHATQGKMSGKVAPGFTLIAGSWTRLPADWSGYDELRLDVFNPGKAGSVSIWIGDGTTDYWERHNSSFTLREGQNALVIPVGGLYRGEKGSGKFLDVKKISQMVVVFPKEGADAFYLDNFRLVKGTGKVETRLLIGFEDGEKAEAKWSIEDWPEDKPGKSVATVGGEHATQGAKALKFEFRASGGALVVSDFPSDWSGYDSLAIDCFNTSDTLVKISGWFRDEVSKDGDYWQRHNYQANVKPGASTVTFPVGGLYRGEKGSGKFLDTKKLVSFCIATSGRTIFFDNVRLVKGTEEAAVEGLKKFDFGLQSSPTYPGFTAVYAESTYDAAKGFGWVGAGGRDARNHEQPDALLCDFIRVNSGQVFAVDLPNGEYTVTLGLDAPMFWDYLFWGKRSVEAGGKEVLRQTLTNAQFIKDGYLKYENDEDLPGVDVWQRYVGDRFKPAQFNATVADGKLEVRFVGDTWGLTPAYLVVWPAAQSDAGKRWLDQLNSRRRESFYSTYAEVVRPADPKPTASDAEKAAGYILFSRALDREVTYSSAPGKDPSDTREPKMDFALTPGEYGTFAFAVYPLKDCGGLKLSFGGLASADGKKIAAASFRARVLKYKFKRIGGRITSSFEYRPECLVDFDSFAIGAGVTRQFWVTLKVPKDAAPGKYAGIATIALAGTTRDIPVSVEVYPFALDEPKMSIGMYGGATPTGGTYWPADVQQDFRFWDRVEEVLRDQKEHGMTAVTPIAPAFKGIENGKAVFDYTSTDRFMDLLRKIGYDHECFTYANMFRVGSGDLEKDAQAKYGMPLEQAIRLAYEELGRHAKEKNWLPVAWALADEPLIHGVSAETVTKVFDAHRKAAPQMQFVMEDAMGDPAHYVVIPSIDIVCANSPRYKVAEEIKKQKSRYWFNNIGTDRYTFGWFLWKAKAEMGVEALFQWGYSTNHGDIYYDLDGFEGDSGCSFTASFGQRARPHWELIRDGAADHRYLQTLANLIAKSEKEGGAASKAKAAEAKKFCDDVMAKIDLERKGNKVYSHADLEAFKRKLAGYIVDLKAGR